jgi:hypothetical protein
MIPQRMLADDWEIRECFHRHYQRDFFFIVAEDDGNPVGLFPLCFVPEENSYVYFPGEVWHGKTWIEQNRLMARDQDVFDRMLEWMNEQGLSYHLRYLSPSAYVCPERFPVDEIGYLFHAGNYQHDMDIYYSTFSRRSIKSIKKEVAAFEERGMQYRFDDPSDFDLLVKMNIERFGQDSYYADDRFTESFRDMMRLLQKRGWFRMVTVLIEGKPAATDIGSVYNNVYTLLAGGTSADFVGIAKVINLFHMKRACQEQFGEADFLCGDFSWKTMFHLTPRPLYLISNKIADASPEGA